MKDISLENKCGSCDFYKQIGETANGDCLKQPYGEDVAHDPEHPFVRVARSRVKCYRHKRKTNGDRIRSMTDEELAYEAHIAASYCAPRSRPTPELCSNGCTNCWLNWLKQPYEEEKG